MWNLSSLALDRLFAITICCMSTRSWFKAPQHLHCNPQSTPNFTPFPRCLAMSDSSKAVRFADNGAGEGLNPVEKAVEGVKCAAGAAVNALLENTPGTAERALKKQLEEEGDISVDTGAPLPTGAAAADGYGGSCLHVRAAALPPCRGSHHRRLDACDTCRPSLLPPQAHSSRARPARPTPRSRRTRL
jgi:hypothetical protein